jgi:S1-C subfamily serine protease
MQSAAQDNLHYPHAEKHRGGRMATEFTCPKCSARARSARDYPSGATVKCPACAHVFSLGGCPDPGSSAAGAADSAASAPVADVLEVLPVPPEAVESARSREADENDRPRSRRPDDDERDRPRSRRRDDDDDRGRPRSRRDDDEEGDRRRPRRRDDDDERPRSTRYDEDDDRADRPRRKKKGSGTALTAFLVIGLFVFMLAAVGGTILVYSLLHKDKSTQPVSVVIPPSSKTPGDTEEPVPRNLKQPPDDSPPDVAPLSASASSILSDPPYLARNPRRLIGPEALAAAVKTPPAAELGASLPRPVLEKVKKATTMMVVTMADNTRATGSGFFVGNDVVATNAHVVGMLAPGSEKPKKIEVVLNSGEANEVDCVGQLLAADPDNDLALVRVMPPAKAIPFPASLEIAGAGGLSETQSVVVFGFPLGEQLGRGVTVNPAQVSKLRRDASGAMERVQVKGGMEHGNSGGPVVDTAGNVVGVSVAKIEGTEINFAVPAERVSALLQGQLLTLTNGDLAHPDAGYTLPVTIKASDPLRKIKEVALDWWWGDARQKVPAGREAAPGPAKRQSTILKAGSDGIYTGTLPLGAKFESKVLWIQVHQRDATGRDLYYQGLATELLPAAEARPIQLQYRPRKQAPRTTLETSYTERVSLHDGGLHSAQFNAVAQLREERLGQDPTGAWFFRLGFDKLSADVTVDGQPQPRSLSIQDHLQHLPKTNIRIESDNEGRVTRANPSFKEVPAESQRVLGRFATQVAHSLEFASIPFPQGEIQPQHTWHTNFSLPMLSSEHDVSLPFKLSYTYRGVRTIDGRQVAELSIAGEGQPVVLGRGFDLEDVPEVHDKRTMPPGKVTGYAFVDVKTGVISKMHIVAESSFADVHFSLRRAKAACILEVKLQRQ